MSVSYDSCKLVPAPLIAVTKQYNVNSAGEKIGATYEITIKNKCLATKGSPRAATVAASGFAGFRNQWWQSSGYPSDEDFTDEQRLGAIIKKQEAFRGLFANEGKSFEVESLDGATVMRFNPRIKSINIPEGIFFQYFDYEVQMEADIILINGVTPSEDAFTYALSNVTERWEIQFGEIADTFQYSHDISAQGKTTYSSTGVKSEAWQQAKSYVTSRLGLNLGYANSGVLNLPSYYGGYNRKVVENSDIGGGSYGVQETWILASGTYIEDFKVQIKTQITSPLTQVSVEGTVKGLVPDPVLPPLTGLAYFNANVGFTQVANKSYARANTYSGKTLNPITISTSVGKNVTEGVITYSYEYDNRVSNYFSNALNEQITINDTFKTPIIPEIPVLGRSLGPIFQDVSTVTKNNREVSVDLTLPPFSGNIANFSEFLAWRPDYGSLMSGLMPVGTEVWLETNTETINPKNGIANKRMAWKWE